MKFTLIDLFSFSIFIASVIGWVRFRQIHPTYYPFLYCTWLALANELLGYFLINYGYSNAININIYVLAEALLYTWQFRKWDVMERYRNLVLILVPVLIVFWGVEAFLIAGIRHTITYFRIFYAFILVLFSIDTLNHQVLSERTAILKNPVFLICIGFMVYYTFTVIIGVFWIYGFGGSSSFRRHMVWILIYINLVVNLVFALAVLWMPKKLRFSLPY